MNFKLTKLAVSAGLIVALVGMAFPADIESKKDGDTGLSLKEREQLMIEIATVFRSARKVISVNQSLINDPTVGDKGLDAKTVVEKTKVNYKAAVGEDLPTYADGTLQARAHAEILNSVTLVIKDAQELINVEGMGFKGFLPAVFAKGLADRFTKNMEGQMYIKLTAPKAYVRNRANRPDNWEQSVIETKFKSEAWVTGQTFSESAPIKKKPAYRLLLPEYYSESCLKCHGGPKGERDITGGKKEGGVLGELGGAISVGIYD